MYSMGGLAQFCVTPASAVTALLPHVPFAESATLGCALFTAYGAC
jgi:NADPH:quinone reductase-like Zn-dependent oxidoreductase